MCQYHLQINTLHLSLSCLYHWSLPVFSHSLCIVRKCFDKKYRLFLNFRIRRFLLLTYYIYIYVYLFFCLFFCFFLSLCFNFNFYFIFFDDRFKQIALLNEFSDVKLCNFIFDHTLNRSAKWSCTIFLIKAFFNE